MKGEMVRVDQQEEQEMQEKAAQQVISIEWNSRIAMYATFFTAGMVYGGFRRVLFNQGTILRAQGELLRGMEHVSGQVVELAANSVSVSDVVKLSAKAMEAVPK